MEAVEAIMAATRGAPFPTRSGGTRQDRHSAACRGGGTQPGQPAAVGFCGGDRPGHDRQIARYLVEVQETRVFNEFMDMPASRTERMMGFYEGFEQTPCFVLLCLQPKAIFARPKMKPCCANGIW